MRQYELYVRNKRQYEVVPVGFAWGALLLGPIWAIGYGLFPRYLAIFGVAAIPLVVTILFGMSVFEFGGLVGMTAIYAGHIYFAVRAFEWRRSFLTSHGYELVASFAASSASAGLQRWSQSAGGNDFI